MSKASELFAIVKDVRSKTPIQLKYEAIMSRLDVAAHTNHTDAVVPIIKKSVFENMQARLVQEGAQLPDDYAEKEYQSQYTIADMLKADGFDVTIEKSSGLILLGNQENQQDPNQEAEMTISWDNKE